MLLNISFVFAICLFIDITLTHFLPINGKRKYVVLKNREELINLIRSLKFHENGHNNFNERDDNELEDEEKEKKLQNILWLLKKNINAQKYFEYKNNNRLDTPSRIYFIRNPSVLDEYKNHLNETRRILKVISRNNIDQQSYLKDKLLNVRRNAMFRLVSGASETDSEDINRTDENKQKVNNDMQVQSNDQIAKIQDQEEIQDTNKDRIEEYPEIKESLELHNRDIHGKLRSDYDFRREKIKWDKKNERQENLATVEEGRNKKDEKRIQSSHKKNRFEVENINRDKITTKEHQIKYNKKKKFKEFSYNIKPSYNKPKNSERINKDFYTHVRTSIPFVGKKGIYDEK